MQPAATPLAPRAVSRCAQGCQTLGLMALFLVVLLGMTALAVDGGNWYQVRSQLQASADAAAPAGTSQFPAGASAVNTRWTTGTWTGTANGSSYTIELTA